MKREQLTINSEQRTMIYNFVLCYLLFALCSCLTIQEIEDIGSVRTVVRNAPTEQEEAGVIFQWNRAASPLHGLVFAANTPYYSGYNGIYFAARGNPIMVSNDSAFRMGAVAANNLIVNNRLMIGTGDKTGTGTPVDPNQPTTAARHSPGQFNFSQGTFRLTVDYRDAAYNNDYIEDPMFRFTINNNRDEQERSVLGNASNVREYKSLAQLQNGIGTMPDKPGVTDRTEPGRIIITFTPQLLYEDNPGAASLENAFLTILTWTNQLTIVGIKLERTE